MDEVRDHLCYQGNLLLSRIQRIRLRVEILSMFLIMWVIIVNVVLYNFDYVVHHLGYLNIYLETNFVNEAFTKIFYVRYFVLLFVISAYFLVGYFRKVFKKPTEEDDYRTMQELRRKLMFNGFYSCAPLNEEQIESLNKIDRDKLVVRKFLGNGNFGDVYSGQIQLMERLGPCVALKSLRKDKEASDKNAFLQEALLMSCFDHENIVNYIGICLDSDENFIIMELMEGGDLLSYLREYRTLNETPEALTVQDLMTMCVDIAEGCKYLEDMQFVHRDLACRNCLVSSRDPAKRRIKIGDFGLARKLYQSDYYRVNKNLMLPIRWMAPESLIDGIFTSKTDVWSLGIVCWEVMTLGFQPYEEMTQEEVLRHVKKGGKLEKPEGCSDPIFEIMSSCWVFSAEERPTLSLCLDKLELQLNRIKKSGIVQFIPNVEPKPPPEKGKKDKNGQKNRKSNYFKMKSSATDEEKLAQNLKELSNLGKILSYSNREKTTKSDKQK